MKRLVILTEIISPYRIPLFNTLAKEAGVDLHVIFLAETDPSLRQWAVYRDEIQFSYEVLASWRKRAGRHNLLLNSGLRRALKKAAPDLIVCGGYNYLASWEALFWARHHGIPFLLWSESNIQDIRRGYALVELLKGEFLKRCTGFVVPGRSAREYLCAQKMDDSRIFTAPNAVDNKLFYSAAEAARQNAGALRAELNLPNRYFLFVGRLVRDKGVFDLFSAYAKLNEATRQQVGLVYAGDGDLRRQLEDQATGVSGMIRFAGFLQRDQLATYYALADMLILPTYSDPWGLVVNEAMACGLPVIVSRVAGCAADLVRENWNGLLISSGNIESLKSAMDTIARNPDQRASMATNSMRLISNYTPADWSCGIMNAIAATGGQA